MVAGRKDSRTIALPGWYDGVGGRCDAGCHEIFVEVLINRLESVRGMLEKVHSVHEVG